MMMSRLTNDNKEATTQDEKADKTERKGQSQKANQARRKVS
jgi:hypothetical protein